jgi:hypothetical protein
MHEIEKEGWEGAERERDGKRISLLLVFRDHFLPARIYHYDFAKKEKIFFLQTLSPLSLLLFMLFFLQFLTQNSLISSQRVGILSPKRTSPHTTLYFIPHQNETMVSGRKECVGRRENPTTLSLYTHITH